MDNVHHLNQLELEKLITVFRKTANKIGDPKKNH